MNTFATTPTIDWLMIAPVVIVSLGGVLALLLEMFRPKADNTAVIAVTLLSFLAAAASLVSQLPLPDAETFAGMVYRDRPALILQILICLAAFTVILFSEQYLRARRIPFAEFYPLALWSAAGAMMMVGTQNLLMIFIGLEVLSIALYVMAGMAKQETKSEESAMKYFLLGAFASAWLLFGVAYIFGTTGTLDMGSIAAAALSNSELVRGPLIFGVAMLMIGLLFKSALVPFHQWTPDVYQGAPINVTAFMASVSKIAAIGTLFRILDSALPLRDFYMPVLTVIAILTMVVGNVIALSQTDVKRLMGYSSVANAGYLLVGILSHLKNPSEVPLTTTIFYLVTYATTTLCVFAVLTLSAKRGVEGTKFSDLNGLYHREPFAAVCLAICTFSLIGIPPLGGFWGKFFLFNDAIRAQLLPLAIVLAVTSIISIGYYLNIVRAVWVQEPEGEVTMRGGMPMGTRTAVVLCTAVIVLMSVLQTPITNFIEGSKESQLAGSTLKSVEQPAQILSLASKR